MTFKFPEKLPKEWIEAIERDGRVGSEIHGLKVVGKDKRGTIVHLSKDSFKILHNGKNQNVFGNPLVGGLDPNFGYETIGTYTATIYTTTTDTSYIRGSVFTVTEAGTADSITAALRRATAGSATVRFALYKHSDLSLVGQTTLTSLSLTTGFAWYTLNFPAPKPSLIANTEYIIVACSEAATGSVSIAYDAGATNQGHYQEQIDWDGTFPDPLVPTHENNKYSIYCSYTPLVPVVKKPIMKIDLGPHPRSRLLFTRTLMLKGVGASSQPSAPTLWDSWDYLWVAVL
jgi:hypothetical protein